MTQTDPSQTKIAVLLAALENTFVLVFAKFPKWIVRFWCPYAYYLIDSTARYISYMLVSIPVLLGVLYLSSYAAGGPETLHTSISASTTLLSEWYTRIISNPHYIAIVLALYYLATAVLPYEPHDDKRYRWKQTPDGPYEWEVLAVAIPQTSAVVFTFASMYFTPNLVSQLPGGVLVVAISLSIVSSVLTRRMMSVSKEVWVDEDSDYQHEIELLEHTSREGFLLFIVSLLVVASGVPSDILGIPVVEILYYLTVVAMVFLTRRIRWALYEDRDGFVNIRPHIRTWGALARVPILYALLVVATTGFADAKTLGFPVFCTFSPVAVALGYLTFRVVRTNRNMYDVVFRAGFDPDDVDIDGYIEDAYLTPEQSRALQPRNKLWTELSRAGRHLRAINPDAAANDLPKIDPRVISRLTKEYDSTYERRKRRIARAKSALRSVERRADYDELPEESDLQESIEAAKESLGTAQDLNEEVGKRATDHLTSALFD